MATHAAIGDRSGPPRLVAVAGPLASERLGTGSSKERFQELLKALEELSPRERIWLMLVYHAVGTLLSFFEVLNDSLRRLLVDDQRRTIARVILIVILWTSWINHGVLWTAFDVLESWLRALKHP